MYIFLFFVFCSLLHFFVSFFFFFRGNVVFAEKFEWYTLTRSHGTYGRKPLLKTHKINSNKRKEEEEAGSKFCVKKKKGGNIIADQIGNGRCNKYLLLYSQ